VPPRPAPPAPIPFEEPAAARRGGPDLTRPVRRRPGLRRRDPRFCLNHEERPSEQPCADCGDGFCADCLVTLQGKPATAMYVIRRGKVQLSRCEEHGKETVIGILGEGDCFGERALLRDKPYGDTALALEDCEFSVLRREHLAFAGINDPNFRRTIDAYINSEETEDVAYNELQHRR